MFSEGGDVVIDGKVEYVEIDLNTKGNKAIVSKVSNLIEPLASRPCRHWTGKQPSDRKVTKRGLAPPLKLPRSSS